MIDLMGRAVILQQIKLNNRILETDALPRNLHAHTRKILLDIFANKH